MKEHNILNFIFFPIKEALFTVKKPLILLYRLFKEEVFLTIKLIKRNILFKIEFLHNQLLKLKSLFFVNIR